MYKITLSTAIVDRNFERSDTDVCICVRGHDAWYKYETAGTYLDIYCASLTMPEYLLEKGYQLKISAETPKVPNPSLEDQLNDAYDTISSLTNTIQAMQAKILHLEGQLAVLRRIRDILHESN